MEFEGKDRLLRRLSEGAKQWAAAQSAAAARYPQLPGREQP